MSGYADGAISPPWRVLRNRACYTPGKASATTHEREIFTLLPGLSWIDTADIFREQSRAHAHCRASDDIPRTPSPPSPSINPCRSSKPTPLVSCPGFSISARQSIAQWVAKHSGIMRSHSCPSTLPAFITLRYSISARSSVFHASPSAQFVP